MNSIIILLIISSISIIKSLPLPQAHGIPDLLLIAINQISSQGTFTFSRVEDLLINTLSQQTDLLRTYNEPLTFIAPTDDAFDDYLARQNTSLQTLASGNESVKLMEYFSIPRFVLFKEIQLDGFTPFATNYESSDLKIGRDRNGTITIQSGAQEKSRVLLMYTLQSVVEILVVDRVPTLPLTNLSDSLQLLNATRSIASLLWSAVEYHSIASSVAVNHSRLHTFFIPSDYAIERFASSVNTSVSVLLADKAWIASLLANHTLAPSPPTMYTNDTHVPSSLSSFLPLYSFMLYGPLLLQSNQSITILGQMNGSLLVTVTESSASLQSQSNSTVTVTTVSLVAPDILLAGRGVFHIIDSIFSLI